jgi:hypothetical protein
MIKSLKYWSVQHMQGAASLVALLTELDRSAELVKADASKGNYTGLVRYRAYVNGVVFSTVAFLEATINETLFEPSFLMGLDPDDGLAIAGAGPLVLELRRLPTLDKYQLTLVLTRRSKFDQGAQPYQDAAVLISLRNELLHYVPERIDPRERERIVKKIANKFPLSPVEQKGIGEQHLDLYLGSGCARWAVEASLSLTDEFFRRLDVTAPYEQALPKPRDFLR